jgi:type II secretory pathway component PulJ
MKSVMLGLVISAFLGLGAYLVLDGKFQMSATDHFQTEGVRL